jgi:hypothetical protein
MIDLPRSNFVVDTKCEKLHTIALKYSVYMACDIIIPNNDILNNNLHIVLKCNVICQQLIVSKSN